MYSNAESHSFWRVLPFAPPPQGSDPLRQVSVHLPLKQMQGLHSQTAFWDAACVSAPNRRVSLSLIIFKLFWIHKEPIINTAFD